DEPRDPVVVLERAPPAPPTHVQRALRETEVLLVVDQQEVDPVVVLLCRPDAMQLPPLHRRLEELLLVRRVRPATRVRRIVEIRDRQLGPIVRFRHLRTSTSRFPLRPRGPGWRRARAAS